MKNGGVRSHPAICIMNAAGKFAMVRSALVALALCAVLTACGGGGARSVLPGGTGSGAARNGGVVIPKSSNVALFDGTLWYGAGGSLFGVPLQSGGASAELDGTMDGIVDPVPVAMTIAPDGTLYNLISDGEVAWQLQAYAPGTFGSARPEEVIAGSGYPQQIVLVGDGIDVLSTVGFNTPQASSTLWTFAYGAGDRPQPIRKLNLGANVNDVASDTSDRIYVARRGAGISVYPAAATCNCSPIRTIASGAKPNDAIAISRDGIVYVLSKDPNTGTAAIDSYAASNNGPAPTLSVGPIAASRGTPMGGIAVDSDGKVYVNFKDARNRNSVDVYAPGANGAAAPQRTIVTPVNGGYVTAIAIGPLVAGAPAPQVSGTLYVGDGFIVNAFALGASGAAVPQRTLTALLGPDFAGGPAYDRAGSMATTSDGRLFVSRVGGATPKVGICSIAELSADANGASGLMSASPCNALYDVRLARGPGVLVDQALSTSDPTTVQTDVFRGVPANGDGGLIVGYAAGAFATDPRGEIYLADGDTIREYAANAGSHDSPVRTISLNGATPNALAVSAGGTLYAGVTVTNRSFQRTGVIDVVPPGQTSPSRTITLPDAAIDPIAALAADSADELYVAVNADPSGTKVNVYAPGASGSAAPIRTIVNPVSSASRIAAMTIFQ